MSYLSVRACRAASVSVALAALLSAVDGCSSADPASGSGDGGVGAPDGTDPGLTSDGSSPEGSSPDGSSPDGSSPDGARPDSATPNPDSTWLTDVPVDDCDSLGNAGGRLFVGGRELLSIPKAGGPATKLAPAAPKNAFYSQITAFAGNVYFVLGSWPGQILWVPQSGGAAQTFTTLPSGASQALLSTDGTALYWSYYESSTGGHIYKATVPAGAPTVVASISAAAGSYSSLSAYPGGYKATTLGAVATAPPYYYLSTGSGNGLIARYLVADDSGWVNLAQAGVDANACGGAACGDQYGSKFIAAGPKGVYWAGDFLDFSRPKPAGAASVTARLYGLPVGAVSPALTGPAPRWTGTDAEMTGPITLDDTTLYWLVFEHDASNKVTACSIHAAPL
jgi:hypothetical protein